MCGIVGIRRFDGLPVEPRLLRLMSDQVAHRGPDGEGVWTSGGVGLAHRRLAIIDVAGSPQPMASPDEQAIVSFNGEILNYPDLRAQLDYPFRTQGDTEVLLAAYRRDGPASVERLVGQFAYALVDRRSGDDLWLFRDRLGILPLYYYRDDRVFLFASEIKSLLAVLPTAPEVDLASLDGYLARRAVRAPYTMFQGVRKLPAGHRLLVRADSSMRLEQYWTPPEVSQFSDIEPEEAVSLLGEALDRAVDRCLVADVPVGAYLSGGVDSSLIVATMKQRHDSGVVKTFAAGFGDPRIDELTHAREVSGILGTEHHEVHVSADAFQQHWQRLTWHRDAPISEPADIAVWHLATAAREQVKVVLSGEGSDELFAGYPKHRFARLTAAAGSAPAFVRRGGLNLAEHLLPESKRRVRIAARALAATSEQERMDAWFSPFTRAERRQLLGPGLLGRDDGQGGVLGGPPLHRMLHRDCFGGWLADNLLERGDRMSMAASLELRPPFLDHELVELAFSLPPSVKLRGGTGKWVVKELARRYLPDRVVDRKKAGFRVPLDSWFRGSLQEMAHDRLLSSSSFVSDVLDRRAVATMLAQHSARRSNEDIRIWTLLCLEIWHETFFTERTPTAAAASVR